jgi:hypothetical protein
MVEERLVRNDSRGGNTGGLASNRQMLTLPNTPIINTPEIIFDLTESVLERLNAGDIGSVAMSWWVLGVPLLQCLLVVLRFDSKTGGVFLWLLQYVQDSDITSGFSSSFHQGKANSTGTSSDHCRPSI